jgi:hypothetical protein
MKTTMNVIISSLLLFLMQNAMAAVAGHVQFLNGKVHITNASGKTGAVKKGDAVNESDTLVTAQNASAQLKMQDGGLIALRPDTSFKIESFKFSGKEDGKEQSFFSLLKGGIRAITGMIGQTNKQNYKIAASSVTIGIRGTDHETWVVLPGSEMAASVPPGIYNKVNTGETTLTTDQGTINILPNQMGYAANAGSMPQLQPVNLKLFTVAASPAPAAAGKTATLRDSTLQDLTLQDAPDITTGNIIPGNAVQTPIRGKSGPTAPTQVF